MGHFVYLQTVPNAFILRDLNFVVLKMTQKRGFLKVLIKNLIYSYALFLTQYENENGVVFIFKSHFFVKLLVFELWSKNFRIQDSLKCNMSKTSWGMKLTFWSWISTHKNNRYSWAFQMGVLRKEWACPKWWRIVSGFISRISWVIWC